MAQCSLLLRSALAVFIGLASLGATSAASVAQTTEVTEAQAAALSEALGLTALLPVLRSEGLVYGQSLEGELFPPQIASQQWDQVLESIYRLDRMEAVMTGELQEALPAEFVAPLMAFFASERGRRIVGLEVSAREAMLDEAVEVASEEKLDQMRADDDPRLAQILRFVQVNDLVEMNVAGALNSNLAFYQGLMAGGAFEGELTEADILADVWSQAEDIRLETSDWLMAYLSLAYAPLDDADLDSYIALSERPEGVALNRVLFGAFDVLFRQISQELGRAAAIMMIAEDI